MIAEAAELDRALFDRVFDVCVVGTGPAGMTVARRLAERGFAVALMEGGGLDLGPESQDLYVEGESVGLNYDPLDIPRLRLFGGSSNHWAGKCRAFDAIDFEPHAHHPLSGWPIGKADLDPFAAAADAILDLPPAAEFPDLPLTQEEARFRRVQFRYSAPPTMVGLKYHDEIAASPRITCVLHANLVDLRLDADLATVTGAVFKSFAPGDPGFTVRARSYCLALGGLETPRMLLNFRSQLPAGIGNQNDLVGRYFSEHPHFRVGQIVLERPVSAAEAAAAPEEIYAPTPGFLEAHEVLAFSIAVRPEVEPPLEFLPELARSVPCATDFSARLAESVLGRPLRCDRRGIGRYFSQSADGQAWWAWVNVVTEQSLVYDSRVALSEERDPFGLQRIRFDWRIGDIDFRTIETAALELGAHYAEQGLGRMQLHDWLLVEPPTLPGKGEGHRVGGHHHMCATRMSADPRQGVVDADCRVHGTANLYIGGSSAFATGGYVNPTYTIVQLALRLGDHLADTLRA